MATQKPSSSQTSAKAIHQRRNLQFTQLGEAIPSLSERVAALSKQSQQHTLLESVTAGLYEE